MLERRGGKYTVMSSLMFEDNSKKDRAAMFFEHKLRVDTQKTSSIVHTFNVNSHPRLFATAI